MKPLVFIFSQSPFEATEKRHETVEKVIRVRTQIEVNVEHQDIEHQFSLPKNTV